MPDLSSTPELSALARASDPLLVASGSTPTDAWSATRDAFPGFGSESGGLRPRAWRSKKWLTPSPKCSITADGSPWRLRRNRQVARLSAAGPRTCVSTRQPVVVATATKALQAQLREEAAPPVRGSRAPFRQVQGVGNYVCARELEDALPDREASGFALAVAIRALASSPTGAWDDVTDDVIRIRDSRYARTRARIGPTRRVRSEAVSGPSVPLMQQVRGLEKRPASCRSTMRSSPAGSKSNRARDTPRATS